MLSYRGDDLRTCERCGEQIARDLAVLVFLTPAGGIDLRRLRADEGAAIEIWCDDCQAERGALWAMCTGDPLEDCETVEHLYGLRISPRSALHAAWARLRDGPVVDLAGA